MDVDVPPPAYTPRDAPTNAPDDGAWLHAGSTWFDDASPPPPTTYAWLSESEREREHADSAEPLPRYAPMTVPVYTFADHRALQMGLGSSYRSSSASPQAVFVWRQDTRRRRSIEPLLAPPGMDCPSYCVEARGSRWWWWGKGPEWTLVRKAARHARFEEEREEDEDAGQAWRSESFASGGSAGSDGAAASAGGADSEPVSPAGTSAGESVLRALRRSSTLGSSSTRGSTTGARRRSDATATAWSTTAEVAHLDLERSQYGSGFSLSGARGGQQSPRWMPRAKLALVRDPLAPAPRVVHLSAPNFADFDLALDEEDPDAPPPPPLLRTRSPRSSTEEDTLAFSPTTFSSSESSESEASSRSSYTSGSSSGSRAVTSAEPPRPTTVGGCFPRGRPPPPPPRRRRKRTYTWRLVTEPDESSALVLLDRTARDVPAPVVARFAYAARDGRGERAGGEEVGTLEVYARRPHRDDADDELDDDDEGRRGEAARWREWELEVLIGTCELVCQYWRSMGRRFRGGVGATGGYAAPSSAASVSSGLSASAARRRSWRAAGSGRGPVVWDGGVDASWNDMY